MMSLSSKGEALRMKWRLPWID